MISTTKLFPDLGCIVDGRKSSDLFTFSQEEVRSLLKEYGAVFFRGFDIDVEEFKKFSDKCCSKYMSHSYALARNKFAQFGADTTITEVTVGQNDLALHGEMYHSPDSPEVIWFYCQTPSEIGGETTLADAAKVYLELPPSIKRLFERKKIRYKHNDPKAAWATRYGSDDIQDVMAMLKTREGVVNVHTDNEETLIFDYITSAIRMAKFQDKKVLLANLFINKNPANRPDFNLKNYHTLITAPAPVVSDKKRAISVEFADGTQIPDDVLIQVDDTGSCLTLDLKWQPKDFVMVDNTRVLHGRRAFQGKRVIATRIAAAA